MNKYLKTIDNIDDERFNWWISSLSNSIVSFAVFYEGKYFKISSFDKSYEKDFLVFDINNIVDIINTSTATYGAITLVELANIADIISRNNIDFKLVDVMQREHISDRKKFDTILSIKRFSDDIKRFLEKKKLPIKSIEIISKLSKDNERFLSDYIKLNSALSYQDIKIFLEDLIIYGDIIYDKKYQKEFKFPKNIDKKHSDVDDMLSSLNKKLYPISIVVDDSYESGELKFLANISDKYSFDDYKKTLFENEEEIKKYIELIKKYGLY